MADNCDKRTLAGRLHHKTCFLMLAVLFMTHGQLAAGGLPIAEDSETCDSSRTYVSTDNFLEQTSETVIQTVEAGEGLFPIYYGPNDSHGRSWVRQNSNGVVGFTYFQHDEGSYDEGTLIYKTILPDGSQDMDTLTTSQRLEKSILLYDASDEPYIFVARSSVNDQVIDQYSRNDSGEWQSETILHFYNEGGKFIYELSADTGPDDSFHLLILKSRSDVDSDDYWFAWLDSHLYHLTNASGSWVNELIHNYDMAYTWDTTIKSSIRQDIKVDQDGYVHVVFSTQINASYDPSRLRYATNKTGTWVIETALTNYAGLVDDAGWYPSLCLDNNGIPYVSCVYLNRVLTYSANYATLLLLKRERANKWSAETIAAYDDGYYGTDGRDYTGALCHLVFDSDNTPHIIFSDICSSHYNPYQRMSVGNIRYGIYEDGAWTITTVYRQPSPTSYNSGIEMLWMCLVVSEQTGKIHVIGQELDVVAAGEYTCRLIELAWSISPTDVFEDQGSSLPDRPRLSQNHPNPFNAMTSIEFDLPRSSRVTVTIYNLLGQQVEILATREFSAGNHSISWNGTDHRGKAVPSGVYFYRLRADDFMETKKMLLLK